MTVINVIELTKTAPGITIGVITFMVLLILSIVLGFAFCAKHERLTTVCFIITVISFFGLFVCISIGDDYAVPNGKYQYEILIDDSTTFSEVNEKYNIIEQRGEIYVVEEREDEESSD